MKLTKGFSIQATDNGCGTDFIWVCNCIRSQFSHNLCCTNTDKVKKEFHLTLNCYMISYQTVILAGRNWWEHEWMNKLMTVDSEFQQQYARVRCNNLTCYQNNAAKLHKIKYGKGIILQTWLDIGQISNGICLVASNCWTTGCLVTA